MFMLISILFEMLLFAYFINGIDYIKEYFTLVLSNPGMQIAWMYVTFILAFNLFFIAVKTVIKFKKGKV